MSSETTAARTGTPRRQDRQLGPTGARFFRQRRRDGGIRGGLYLLPFSRESFGLESFDPGTATEDGFDSRIEWMIDVSLAAPDIPNDLESVRRLLLQPSTVSEVAWCLSDTAAWLRRRGPRDTPDYLMYDLGPPGSGRTLETYASGVRRLSWDEVAAAVDGVRSDWSTLLNALRPSEALAVAE